MPREVPEPRFIEIGLPPCPVVAEPKDLTWQRVTEFLRSRELAANTRKTYERNLQQFYTWLEQKPWHEVTHRDIDRYKRYLKALPSKHGGTLSPATINQSLATLKSFFKWLVVKDYISRNPTVTVELLKEPPKLPDDLMEEQVEQMFAALSYRGDSEIRDRAILHLLFHGHRAGEVSTLNIRHYDGQRVQIEGAKWGSDGLIPLKPEAIFALDTYFDWLVRNGFSTEPDAPMFVSLSDNSRGKRLGYSGIYDLIKALAEAAGLDNIHPHQIRHTFAVDLLLSGMNPMFAKRLMRNRSDRSFARYGDRALQIMTEEAFRKTYGEKSVQPFPSEENT
ncbi:MAG: tyrosine-type recombinase/integrase [Cyanobacteria bacterium P01_A01_bin.17]